MTLSLSSGAVQVRETAPAPPPATRCLHHIPVCFSSMVNSSGTIKLSPTSIICETGRWVTGVKVISSKKASEGGESTYFLILLANNRDDFDRMMSRGRFIFILSFHNHQYQSFYAPVSSRPVKRPSHWAMKAEALHVCSYKHFFFVGSTWLGGGGLRWQPNICLMVTRLLSGLVCFHGHCGAGHRLIDCSS